MATAQRIRQPAPPLPPDKVVLTLSFREAIVLAAVAGGVMPRAQSPFDPSVGNQGLTDEQKGISASIKLMRNIHRTLRSIEVPFMQGTFSGRFLTSPLLPVHLDIPYHDGLEKE